MRPLAGWIAAACAVLTVPAHAANPPLDHGVSAFVSLDAGNQHWSDGFSESGGATSSPVFNHGLADNVGGGVQNATTRALSEVGILHGQVQAASTGYVLSGAQGSNDLSWYNDVLITGTPGTQVEFQFGIRFDGFLAPSGTHYSGGVASTTFVAGEVLSDVRFDAFSAPGPFFVQASMRRRFDVGSVIRLSTRMTVGARAEQDFSGMAADAFNTSAFYMDVLTPGGGYIAGGGVVFDTLPAVPEPGSAALLACGLLALAARRRRQVRA